MAVLPVETDQERESYMGSRGATRHHICYGCDQMISPRKTHKCPGKTRIDEVAQERFRTDDPTAPLEATTVDQNT